jgi:hypothetical protein
LMDSKEPRQHHQCLVGLKRIADASNFPQEHRKMSAMGLGCVKTFWLIGSCVDSVSCCVFPT